MTKLRTAVSGLGRIGWNVHVPAIVAHEGFELTAVVDTLAERCNEAKSQYGTATFTDYTHMLETAKPDVVVVASPTHFHHDQAVAAMESGADVFCDKPMALDLDAADNMIAVMQRTGKKLMVFQPHRATEMTVALQAALATRLIGPVYMAKFVTARYTRRRDWQALTKYGGGMLNNYGAHYIDLLLYLFGGPVCRVASHLRTIASLGDADDVAIIMMETTNGMILDVETNMASAMPMPKWGIFGHHGTIYLDETNNEFVARYFDPTAVDGKQLDEHLAADGRRYTNDEDIPWQERRFPVADATPIDFYDKVYDYFGRGAPPFVPVSETREVMRVIHECRRYSGAHQQRVGTS